MRTVLLALVLLVSPASAAEIVCTLRRHPEFRAAPNTLPIDFTIYDIDLRSRMARMRVGDGIFGDRDVTMSATPDLFTIRFQKSERFYAVIRVKRSGTRDLPATWTEHATGKAGGTEISVGTCTMVDGRA